MIEYREADQEVHNLLGQVMAEHFPVLAHLEPTLNIDIRMAVDDKGKRLQHHGHPVAGMIEIVQAEERSAGGPDVRIKIDHVSWLDQTERQRAALLHHELTHIVPRRDPKGGMLLLDPYGRPKIRLRRDDWMLTGFVETVRVFGEDAGERKSLDAIQAKLTQSEMPFMTASDLLTPKRERKSKPTREQARNI